MAEVEYFSEQEINKFLDDLDRNKNGFIEYDEAEYKLDEVHKEIAPAPKPYHLHHEDCEDAQRHEFLRSVVGTDKNRIPRDDFAGIVRKWKVPSMDPDEKAEEDHKAYRNPCHGEEDSVPTGPSKDPRCSLFCLSYRCRLRSAPGNWSNT